MTTCQAIQSTSTIRPETRKFTATGVGRTGLVDRRKSTFRSVAISPDGKLIAVDVGKGSTSFIYKIAVDTGSATRLTNAKTGEESGPAFSPDGKRIAFSYSPGNGVHSSIVIGNVEGSGLRPWSPSESNDFSPVFSPDNKTIVFSRSGFFGSYSPIAQPHPHAWRFYASDLDGTNVRELTSESFYMASPASVSPDGKNMVIVTEGIDTNRQIAVYSLDRPESQRSHFSLTFQRKPTTRIRYLTFPTTCQMERAFFSWRPATGNTGMTMTFTGSIRGQARSKGSRMETATPLISRSLPTKTLPYS
jgi:Tol biopolymer transport system component